MKIRRIETLVREQAAVVRVTTDDGVVGIGRTAPGRGITLDPGFERSADVTTPAA